MFRLSRGGADRSGFVRRREQNLGGREQHAGGDAVHRGLDLFLRRQGWGEADIAVIVVLSIREGGSGLGEQDASIARVFRALVAGKGTADEYAALTALPALTPRLRERAAVKRS